MSRRMSRARGALLALAMLGALAATGADSHRTLATAGQPPVNAVFRPILPRLRGLEVPVLLPTSLPRRAQAEAALHLYATVEDRTPYSYRVALGYTPDCHGATACRFGEVTGGPVVDTPTIF